MGGRPFPQLGKPEGGCRSPRTEPELTLPAAVARQTDRAAARQTDRQMDRLL